MISDKPDIIGNLQPEIIPGAPSQLPKTGDATSSLPMVTFILSFLGIIILMFTREKEYKTDTDMELKNNCTSKDTVRTNRSSIRFCSMAASLSKVRKVGKRELFRMPVR